MNIKFFAIGLKFLSRKGKKNFFDAMQTKLVIGL